MRNIWRTYAIYNIYHISIELLRESYALTGQHSLFSLIEHVVSPLELCKSLSALAVPNGANVISTINRSMRAYATAIVAAEYILNWSSFLWGYLMSPIIGGALADYYGRKRVMAYGVPLWSLATFLSPWAAARSLWLFLSTRVLLGIAEGVALPSMNNTVLRWFHRTERSSDVGIAMAGFQLGNTPIPLGYFFHLLSCHELEFLDHL